MSHFRRNFGRFTTATANEHHQRQLTAPVNKWKRQWVSPTGLAPESSYKICKWVKQKEKTKLAGAIEVDDNTPVPEGDENEVEEHDEDQDMEEDDQEPGDEEEGEGEGENDEGEGEEDEKPTTTAAQTPAPPSVDNPLASQPIGTIENPTKSDITETNPALDTTTQNVTGSEAAPTSAPTLAPAPAPESEQIPSMVAEPTPAQEATNNVEPTTEPTIDAPIELTTITNEKEPASTVEENHEAPIPTHEPIPSNAIEFTPIAPTSTETGLGETTTTEPIMEIETRPAEDIPSTTDEKMEGIQEDIAKQVEEDDKGLIHGEMDPPTKALEVENTDIPKEVEKE